MWYVEPIEFSFYDVKCRTIPLLASMVVARCPRARVLSPVPSALRTVVLISIFYGASKTLVIIAPGISIPAPRRTQRSIM
eukprot:4105195-Pyramimonas_sp.AAC.1